jgi:hypothetical protein
MKSETLEQLVHYFGVANLGTVEPAELLAVNLNVVREDSEGI